MEHVIDQVLPFPPFLLANLLAIVVPSLLLKLLGKLLLNDFGRLVFDAQYPCSESYPVLSDEYLQNSG